MNTLQILDIFDRYPHKGIFQGVFPCDKLPRKITLPIALVINLSKSNQPGSHWVSLYIDHKGSAEYFCSMGFRVKNYYIETFLKKNCKSITCNTQQLQHITSNYCGLYAVSFIIYKLQGGTLNSFKKKFSKNTIINDLFIHGQYTYYINLNRSI